MGATRRRFVCHLAALPLAGCLAPWRAAFAAGAGSPAIARGARFGAAWRRWQATSAALERSCGTAEAVPPAVTAAWAEAYAGLIALPIGNVAELRALAGAARHYLQPQDDPADPVAATLLRLIEGQEAVLGEQGASPGAEA